MDFEYIKQMNEGLDRNALLDELMMTYGKDVWNYAYFLTKHRELAEDIAQDTFVKAYHNLYAFRGSSSMKAWLLAIARNTSKDYYKSSWFRRVRLIEPDESVGPSIPSAENEWFFSEYRREIWHTVLGLPRKLRETLLLQVHYRLSLKEIADLMQLSEGTVKSRLFRARAAVNRKLGKSHPSKGSL